MMYCLFNGQKYISIRDLPLHTTSFIRLSSQYKHWKLLSLYCSSLQPGHRVVQMGPNDVNIFEELFV